MLAVPLHEVVLLVTEALYPPAIEDKARKRPGCEGKPGLEELSIAFTKSPQLPSTHYIRPTPGGVDA